MTPAATARVLRSDVPLGSYPDRVTDDLVHWARATPDATFLAERDGSEREHHAHHRRPEDENDPCHRRQQSSEDDRGEGVNLLREQIDDQRERDHDQRAGYQQQFGVGLRVDVVGDVERQRVVAAVREHVAMLSGEFGDVAPMTSVRWLPTRRCGSTRFVGRVPDLFAIDDALNAVHHPATTGATGSGVAQGLLASVIVSPTRASATSLIAAVKKPTSPGPSSGHSRGNGPKTPIVWIS